MNFFCKKNHYDEWTKKMKVNEEEIFCLEAREAIHVSKMLFRVDK